MTDNFCYRIVEGVSSTDISSDSVQEEFQEKRNLTTMLLQLSNTNSFDDTTITLCAEDEMATLESSITSDKVIKNIHPTISTDNELQKNFSKGDLLLKWGSRLELEAIELRHCVKTTQGVIEENSKLWKEHKLVFEKELAPMLEQIKTIPLRNDLLGRIDKSVELVKSDFTKLSQSVNKEMAARRNLVSTATRGSIGKKEYNELKLELRKISERIDKQDKSDTEMQHTLQRILETEVELLRIFKTYQSPSNLQQIPSPPGFSSSIPTQQTTIPNETHNRVLKKSRKRRSRTQILKNSIKTRSKLDMRNSTMYDVLDLKMKKPRKLKPSEINSNQNMIRDDAATTLISSLAPPRASTTRCLIFEDDVESSIYLSG